MAPVQRSRNLAYGIGVALQTLGWGIVWLVNLFLLFSRQDATPFRYMGF